MVLVIIFFNFWFYDLFFEERSNWGCEGNVVKFKEEILVNEDRLKFYEMVDFNGIV